MLNIDISEYLRLCSPLSYQVDTHTHLVIFNLKIKSFMSSISLCGVEKGIKYQYFFSRCCIKVRNSSTMTMLTLVIGLHVALKCECI